MKVRTIRGLSFHEKGRGPLSTDARYLSSSAYFSSAGRRSLVSLLAAAVLSVRYSERDDV